MLKSHEPRGRCPSACSCSFTVLLHRRSKVGARVQAHTHEFDSLVVQLLSVCGQTLNFSSSALSLVYSPATRASCCVITLTRSSSDSSEQVTINILNVTRANSPLTASTTQSKTIDFSDYATSTGAYLKSDIQNLPLTFNVCRFDAPFEILITNISKGKPHACRTTPSSDSLRFRTVSSESVPLFDNEQ